MKLAACPLNSSRRPSQRSSAGHPSSARQPRRRNRSQSSWSSLRNFPCCNDSASSRTRNKSPGISPKNALASCSTKSPMCWLNAGKPAGAAIRLLLPQSCCLVVQGIDDRGKYETRPVVVELDKLPTAPGRKMKIPSAEKANLLPSKLRNRRRLAQGRRLPGLTGGNAVKSVNEIGYFGEDGAGDDLMLRHHGEFSRRLRHPGSLERGVEVLGRPRLELQPILSTC